MVPVRLPHPALPLADWADCYRLHVAGHGQTAETMARKMFSKPPGWIKALMAVRNRVVGLFGLKPAGYRPSHDVGMIGMFPIVSRSPARIVLGFDDRHLDFRIVVDVEDDGVGRQTVSLTTLVSRNIRLGRVYLAIIMPFHRLIVVRTLTRLAGTL
ncbi:MAG: DUF2867 domain-containing protein [Allorhizobium sp.]